MKRLAESKLAKKIVETAFHGVEKSVGKCWPVLVHEVKMPECVRKEFMKDNMSEGE